MPYIQIQMAEGRTQEQKEALLARITQAVVETLDAPVDSVRAWITEFPATQAMAGGELLSARKARLAAERGAGEKRG